MKLGFVSAILPDLALDDVLAFAAASGYSCVEVMCWPPGKADRRYYAGVAHLEVDNLAGDAAQSVRDAQSRHGVTISALGYYPNPLSADRAESDVAVSHLKKLIRAAGELGVGVVNSVLGRDPRLTVEANWPRFLQVWEPLVRLAEEHEVRIGIENGPMLFGADEWPGGKNLATSPAIWRRMFADLPSSHVGLNLDPSHLVWQQIDYLAAAREFGDRISHVQAKDARLDHEALSAHGVLAFPRLWHAPKLPGQGDVRWGALLGTLSDAGYDGPVCVEVEDRAYEGSLAKRKEALVLSARYLRQFIDG